MKERNFGPCAKRRCREVTKTKKATLCPKHNRLQAYKRYNSTRPDAGRRAKADADIDRMLAAPLPRVRTPEYVREEAARSVAGNERAVLMRPGTAAFWYRWYNNPDNLCTKEALDAAGWGVTASDIRLEEELARIESTPDW